MSSMTIDSYRQKAQEIGRCATEPLFYSEKAGELSRAGDIDRFSANVDLARSLIMKRGEALGHGYGHASRVALESGALIYCETGFGPKSDMLAENCIIAGYLHDIKRDEKNHPEKAAMYAGEVLRGRIPERDLEMIQFAIRNHEAFKGFETVTDEQYMLMADALYDADKFRWGPDNFVYTIWDMAESMHLNPEIIFKYYEKGVEGIVRIKQTFRTETGKKYGPDFIDKGLEIGAGLLEFYKSRPEGRI
jgi:hypothetical protein